MNTYNLIKNHKENLLPLLISSLNPNNAIVLFRNYISLYTGQAWVDYVNKKNLTYSSLLQKAISWIKHSQDLIGSGGVGCFEFYRWTKGYPEVTGYIIPTFWDACHYFGDVDFQNRAIKMADWELKIQHADGGWEGQYEGDGKPSVVFNTGQVIRGMIRSYEETQNEKYLASAIRAADWIVSTQDEDGSWTSANYKQMKRVYDTYVSAALSRLFLITGNQNYAYASHRNCQFALQNQHSNGWFEIADNTLLNNEAPVLHTLAYTIDGLIETGLNLQEDKYIIGGKTAADALLHRAETDDLMKARFDKDWKKRTSYSCLTGDAQLGIIFIRLFEHSSDKRYLNAALKQADFLSYTQHINSRGKSRSGGIAGSYPIWGMYCPLKYPSWAAKYYIDLLLLIKKHTHLD